MNGLKIEWWKKIADGKSGNDCIATHNFLNSYTEIPICLMTSAVRNLYSQFWIPAVVELTQTKVVMNTSVGLPTDTWGIAIGY